MSKKTKIILHQSWVAVIYFLLVAIHYGVISQVRLRMVYSYRDEDKDKMAMLSMNLMMSTLCRSKNIRSRYYLISRTQITYVSLLEYEHEIPQQFDPWEANSDRSFNS